MKYILKKTYKTKLNPKKVFEHLRDGNIFMYINIERKLIELVQILDSVIYSCRLTFL